MSHGISEEDTFGDQLLEVLMCCPYVSICCNGPLRSYNTTLFSLQALKNPLPFCVKGSQNLILQHLNSVASPNGQELLTRYHKFFFSEISKCLPIISLVILKQENYQRPSVLQNRGGDFGQVAHLVGVFSQGARIAGLIPGRSCAGINK